MPSTCTWILVLINYFQNTFKALTSTCIIILYTKPHVTHWGSILPTCVCTNLLGKSPHLLVTWSIRCCLNMKLHLLTMLSRACLNGLESTRNHTSNTVMPCTDELRSKQTNISGLKVALNYHICIILCL